MPLCLLYGQVVTEIKRAEDCAFAPALGKHQKWHRKNPDDYFSMFGKSKTAPDGMAKLLSLASGAPIVTLHLDEACSAPNA